MNSTSEAHKVAEYQFWHARLGHVHDKTLKFAVPEVEIPEKKLICHGCRVLYGIDGPPAPKGCKKEENDDRNMATKSSAQALETQPLITLSLPQSREIARVAMEDTSRIEWRVEPMESSHVCVNDAFVVEDHWLRHPRIFKTGKTTIAVHVECTVELPVIVDDETKLIRIERVLYVPQHKYNIISLTQLSLRGYTAWLKSPRSRVFNSITKEMLFWFGKKKGNDCVNLASPYHIPYDDELPEQNKSKEVGRSGETSAKLLMRGNGHDD